MLTLVKFFRWLLTKLAGGALIIVLGLAALGLWFFLRDNVGFDQWRQDTVRLITGERAKLKGALSDVNHRLTTLAAEIQADDDKLRQANKVLADLKAMESTWDRYLGDREQQKKNDERLASVTTLRTALQQEVAQKQEAYTRATWERDGLEIALGKLDVQLKQVEAKRSVVMHYLDRVWHAEVGRGVFRLSVRGWVAIVLAAYFFGPTLGRVVLFFGLAPLVVRGKPVRLAPSATVMPIVGESRVTAEIDLREGERLWIKEKFLQASDEGLVRRTRYVLDWRIPFTCVAAGLIELIEMANSGKEPGEQRLTLSNQADPHSELAVVTLSEGASLVLRPSFLAGVVTTSSRPWRIRRRWQLWRWQSWVTLQFRFFEFVGPCRLIVAGSRGVRAENLADREGPALPARRTNQDATVGFTPNLDYRPVRAETFWSYYRGMNPLFDDLFAGRGIFLCQQVATEGDAKKARKFWSSVWSGVMKIFGL
jgi:hypothetical protein